MNLEDVLGIIIYEDGVPHTFGKSNMEKYSPVYDDDTYYHDTAFREEILPTDWFKSTGYPYNYYSNIVYVADRMASYGFAIILNVSSRDMFNNPQYTYTIQVPQNMTDNMQDFFITFYPKIKDLIDNNHAVFYGEVYDKEQNLVEEKTVDNLDEFYDEMHIPPKQLAK